MVEDTAAATEIVSAAAVLQFAAREAREGRRLAEFGAHAFASVTYNNYGKFCPYSDDFLFIALCIEGQLQMSNKRQF